MLKTAISPSVDLQEPEPYWSEHITTLMALEVQFVFHKRPAHEQRMDNEKKAKKKKNIEYQSGFLFAGRRENKETAGKVEELVMGSHCQNIKKLFGKMASQRKREGMYVLEKMVKIMLSLKHSTIIKQFIELYEEVIKKIVKIEFQAVQEDERRKTVVEKIAEQISKTIKSKPRQNQTFIYKQLGNYMSSKEKDMMEFLRAVVYCFLAELHNFNINEYYMQAFSFEEEERKVPKKKKKLQ